MPRNNAQAAPALRFAALVRVSTEQQAQTGESLRTQRAEIEAAVSQLGGTVAAWYGGQEHATPGYEKKEIGRLLKDAAKKDRPWDAIIASNPDRWSRDNESSKAGLTVFRDHGVRFFVGTTEYDLFNPDHNLFLGMSATMGEYFAHNQSRKSILNRINRAKRGLPTSGKLPYGRTFDKATGKWGIDEKKRAIIEDVARRYLAGEQMPRIAEEYGVNHASLHKTLTQRCSDTWTVEFHNDKLNIHETVPTKVPRLLPEETIKAIREKVEANRTYLHGSIKYRYLLGRMIFCEACGYTMFGQTNHRDSNLRYYRHAHKKRKRPCDVANKTWVKADEIEDAVLRQLFMEFGNPAAVEKAIEAAIPNLDAARELQRQVDELAKLIDKENAGQEKVLALVHKGATSMDKAETLLAASNKKLARYQKEHTELEAAIKDTLTPAQVKDAAEQVASKFRRVSKTRIKLNASVQASNAFYDRMSWEDKRDLVERVFAGKTLDGKRLGVYIAWEKDEAGKTRIRYTVRGTLMKLQGYLPVAGEDAAQLTDPENAAALGQDQLVRKSARY